MNSINLKFSNYTLNIKLRSTNTANAIKNILQKINEVEST